MALAVLVATLSLHQDVPMWLAKGLRAHMSLTVDGEWTTIDRRSIPRIMDRYFGVDAPTGECDVFCVNGVPAASIVYTTPKGSKPIVTEFHANKGLILMFDAGPLLRSTLYDRYGALEIGDAKGKEVLLGL